MAKSTLGKTRAVYEPRLLMFLPGMTTVAELLWSTRNLGTPPSSGTPQWTPTMPARARGAQCHLPTIMPAELDFLDEYLGVSVLDLTKSLILSIAILIPVISNAFNCKIKGGYKANSRHTKVLEIMKENARIAVNYKPLFVTF
jgi:hypothetical protein